MSFFAPQSSIMYIKIVVMLIKDTYQHTNTPCPALEGVKNLRYHQWSLLVLVAGSWF